MPAIEVQNLKQKAVYWEATSPDKFGKARVIAPAPPYNEN